MVKKVVVLGLVISLLISVLPVFSANEQLVTPMSQRYSLTVSSEVHVSTRAILPDLQMLFPLEILTLADSEQSVENAETIPWSEFERVQSFEGWALGLTVWPQALLAIGGMDIETLQETFFTDLAAVSETHPVTLHNGEVMNLYTSGQAGINFLFFLTTDTPGNVYLGMGVAEDNYLPMIQKMLATLKMREFTEAELYTTTPLPMTFEIMPGELALDLPSGWWVLDSDGQRMALPFLEQAFFQSLNGDRESGTGAFLMIMPLDESDITADVYDAEGNFDPKALLASAGTSFMDVGELELIGSAVWQSSFKLTGAAFEFVMADGSLQGMIVVVETGGNLHMAFAAASTPLWEQIQPTYRAMLDTLRVVKAE